MFHTPAAVELRGITKHFGAILANAGVNVRLSPGSIHGIVGENGAGKSTAMKILYGMYRPDAGEILLDGKPCVWSSPGDAITQGIGMVHQHFMLAGPYSALDNILLGAEPVQFGIINRKQARSELDVLARKYGLPVDWSAPVGGFPVGLQQRVEILKLIYRRARILILDEPTSVLTPQETTTLFEHLRQLRDEGKSILLITHKLHEVLVLTDTVTVFRGGKVTGELRTSETNAQELADLMVGRKVVLNGNLAPGAPREERGIEVQHLHLAGRSGSRPRIHDLSLFVRRGEILGIAGVEGNGQSELIQAILHPAESRCRTSGMVKILGQDVSGWHAKRIRDLAVAVVPEDRQREGLLLERSLTENFLLGLHRTNAFSQKGWLRDGPIGRAVRAAVAEYDIRPNDLNGTAGMLSGGNQQKLIIAREFERKPSVLIAAHPTRGVDVGAIEFIHNRIIQARDDGAAILLFSSELDEILALSDRILVMYEGRISAEFKRGEASQTELGLKMGGA
jgi:simple sugar transport system ATP-binding protein